jgi:hypothetical protein
MAFSGAIPINQMNSLPLFSIDQYAFGGTVSVIGGSINRYFSPADTGINGASMNVGDPDTSGPLEANSKIAKSNLLDVRGCSRFTAQLALKLANQDQEHTLGGGGGLAYSYTIGLRIMSPVAADIASVAPHTGACGVMAWPLVGSFVIPHTGEAAIAFPVYNSAARGWQVGGPGAVSLQTGSLGFIYLWFAFLNGAFDTGALLYASLYASS